MLRIKGRIELPEDISTWRDQILELGFIEIPLDSQIAIRAASLNSFHADPADRFIVATALSGYRLATADGLILNWRENAKLDLLNALK